MCFLCHCCCCRSPACCSECVGWLFLCGSSSWLCCCWPSCCPSRMKAAAAPSQTTSPGPSTSCSATRDLHQHRNAPRKSNICCRSVKQHMLLRFAMADIENVDFRSHISLPIHHHAWLLQTTQLCCFKLLPCNKSFASLKAKSLRALQIFCKSFVNQWPISPPLYHLG